MALTAGDMGHKLVDPATGALIEMTPDQVQYQCDAIIQTLDRDTLSRPVICGMDRDGQLAFFAGALSLHQRGLRDPQPRIGKDKAVNNNATLKKVLVPWPNVEYLGEDDIKNMRFLALTRTVQAQAVEFETRQEAQGQIRDLQRELARMREQLRRQPEARDVPVEAHVGEGAMVPYRPPVRRPVLAGSDLRIVDGWLPIVEDGGPQSLKSAVLDAIAPGGFRLHARHSWEALATLIEAYAAVAVRGPIPAALSQACQLALDDFVLAAGTAYAGQHAQLRNLWASKAEGPQALVAALQLQQERGGGRGGGRGGRGRGGRGACFNCGKHGHIAATCRQPPATPAATKAQ